MSDVPYDYHLWSGVHVLGFDMWLKFTIFLHEIQPI